MAECVVISSYAQISELAAIDAGEPELVRTWLSSARARSSRLALTFSQPTPLNGSTALRMCASQKGEFECVRALLEAGADVAQTDAHGSTAGMRTM